MNWLKLPSAKSPTAELGASVHEGDKWSHGGVGPTTTITAPGHPPIWSDAVSSVDV